MTTQRSTIVTMILAGIGSVLLPVAVMADCGGASTSIIIRIPHRLLHPMRRVVRR